MSGEWTIERGEFGRRYLERCGERAIESGIDEPAVIELEGDIADAHIELLGGTHVIDESLAAKCVGQRVGAVADCGCLLVLLGASQRKHAFAQRCEQHLGLVGEAAHHHIHGVGVVAVGHSIEASA